MVASNQPPADKPKLTAQQVENQTRCHQLLHAVQTGVLFEMKFNDGPTSPKHLRVGVNAAMCDNAALGELMVSKGLITLDEWQAARIKLLEREVSDYERRLSEHYGKPVKLV